MQMNEIAAGDRVLRAQNHARSRRHRAQLRSARAAAPSSSDIRDVAACTAAPASDGCDTYDVITPDEDNVSPSMTGRRATAACSGGKCGLTIQTRIDRLPTI